MKGKISAEAAEKKAVMDEMERRMAEFRLVFEAVDARRNEQRANLAEIEESKLLHDDLPSFD